MEQQKKFVDLQNSMISEACDHLGMREEVFHNSQKFYMQDKEYGPKVQPVDMIVRLELEQQTHPEITVSRQDMVKAAKLQLKLNFDMQARVEHLKKQISPQQFGEMMRTEQSKLADQIEVETGIDTAAFMRYHDHYRLREDNELKEFAKTLKERFEESKKKEQQRAMLTPAQAKQLAEMSSKMPKPTYADDGTVDKEFVMALLATGGKFNKERTAERRAKFATDRREALSLKHMEKYELLFVDAQQYEAQSL